MLKKRISLAIATGVIGAALTGAQASADVLTGNLTTDNAFFAYVSSNNAVLGTQIGSGNNWPGSFALTPTTLGPGTYYLQIEAINYGGPGGLIGSFNVGSQSFVTSPSGWSAIYNSSNSAVTPQPWVTPTDATVVTAAYPWGTPSPIAPSAQWIDSVGGTFSGDYTLNSCPGGYCTVDFSYEFRVAAAPGPVPGTGLLSFAVLALGGALTRARGLRSI